MFQVQDTNTESLSSVTYTFSISADEAGFPYAYNYPDLLLKQPEYSGWECELFGAGRGMVFTPEKNKVPNWFWRKMQYLCFGNKWVKAKK